MRMASDDYRTVKISLFSAIFASLATFAGVATQSLIQAKLEIGKIRAEEATQDRKDFLSHSVKLFSALSELHSFFDANHSFERSTAKPLIAQARKAALELSIFTTPELALKAMFAVEALNSGLDANDTQQLANALASIVELNKELISTFYKERAALDQKRTAALE